MKQKLKFILFTMAMILSFFCINNQNVKAATLTETFENYYFYRRGGGQRPHSGEFHSYEIDGKVTFCVEPGIDVTDHTYMAQGESPYDDELTRDISLIAYYGYNYPTHKSLRYRMVTQLMIWEKVGGQQNEIWTEAQGGGEMLRFTDERAEINNLIEHHYDVPSFDGTSKDTLVGGQVTFTDTSNILSEFEIMNSNGANANISGNDLVVTPTKSGSVNIQLKKKTYTNDENIFFYASDGKSQKQVYFGTSDPVYASVTVNTISGSVEIYKTDDNNNKLAGVKFGVYNAENSEVCTITTDSNGYGKCENLAYGNYTIKELSTPEGYAKSETTYSFELNESKTNATLNITNGKIQGYIEIYKVDAENNRATAQGDAKLKGAIYGIYDSNNLRVGELVTDGSGYARSELLPYGNYVVREEKPSEGYLLDKNEYSVSIIEDHGTVTVNSKEEVIKGYIEINKVDAETGEAIPQGNAKLSGAVYEIYDIREKLVATLTTNEFGYAKSNLLPYGTYFLREKTPSEGYKLDKKEYQVKINSNKQVITTTSKEEVIKGYLEIYKVDSENNMAIPQGDAKLSGAVYGIFNSKSEKVEEITTNKDGYAKSKLLPYGNYTIKELKPSEGYKIDNKVYNATIHSDKETIKTTSKEEVLKFKFYLTKTATNGESGVVETEPNVVFNIYLKRDNKLAGTIRTDSLGKANITLPYGIYRVCQIKGTDYTNDSPCFEININNKDVERVVNNEPLNARVKVVKIDSVTKRVIPMAGVKFRIKDLIYDEYVCQQVAYPEVQNICVFETDKNGILYTPYEIMGGEYQLEEVDTYMNGYLWNNTPLKFTISKESNNVYVDDSLGTIIELMFENTPVRGEVNLSKKGEVFNIKDGKFEYEEVPLDNVAYKLYANEDIYSGDGKLMYSKDSYINTYITKNGKLKISNLYLGKYYLVEVSAPDKYVIDKEIHYFELKYKDQYTPVVSVEFNFKNYLKKGTLEFTKTDLSTSEPLPDTTIKIYTINDELIFTGVTDKNGKIVIKDLPVGKYYILEENAPEGYVLNTEKIYFEIKENGEVVKATMKDKPITGTLEFSKEDLSTSEPLPNTLIEIYNEKTDELIFSGLTDEFGKITIPEIRYGKYYILEKEAPEGYVLNEEKMYFEIKNDGEIVKATMTNKLITGTLEFSKEDLSTSEPLPNTLIEIYNWETDELIFSGLTDEFGKIVIPELKYGKYYILEKEAPEGYVLNEEKMYFEIKNDGEIVKATMTNRKIKSIIKFLKVDENNKPLAGVTIGLYNMNDELINTYVTDENGLIEVELEYGHYYFKEIATLDNYILSEDKVEFEVKNDGEIIENQLINELQEIIVPDTFKNDYQTLVMFSLIIIGIGMISYGIIKKRKIYKK